MGHSRDRNQKTHGHSAKQPRSLEKKQGNGKHNWGKPGSEVTTAEAARISISMKNKRTVVA